MIQRNPFQRLFMNRPRVGFAFRAFRSDFRSQVWVYYRAVEAETLRPTLCRSRTTLSDLDGPSWGAVDGWRGAEGSYSVSLLHLPSLVSSRKHACGV